tara:strand:- start:280 stop:1947 length:1668 start_codon:yes stop_codon:yes gene_type:complete
MGRKPIADAIVPQTLAGPDIDNALPTTGKSDSGTKRLVTGTNTIGLSGGGAMNDFNNDGLLDLMTSSWSLDDPIQLLLNKGDGSFKNATGNANIAEITGGLNLICADYDNDGDQDPLILRGAWLNKWGRQPNSLLRNEGEGRFADVTESAGLLSYHPTQTATWFDFNADGNLDLFIGNESNTYDTHPSELYQNNGDGTFSEIGSQSNLTVNQWIKGVASGDFDNDGWPDLYISVLGGKNKLYRNGRNPNNEGWLFEDVTDSAGVGEPIRSFPCWFWDYNNDGWEDLFVGGFNIENVGDITAHYRGLPNTLERPRLYRNNQNGKFDEVALSTGLDECWIPMGANFGDLDNDGYLDFYAGTGDTPLDTTLPNKMYRNNGGRNFQDVTTSGGFGHLQKGHAVSFGDYDNDGDQDVHIVMGGAFSGNRYMNALFQNPGHGNGWIKLVFKGEQSNRNGLGVRLKLTLETPKGPRVIHRTVSTGGSFGGNPFRQEIGLGKATQIDSIEVTWPSSGTRQHFKNIEINQSYTVLEEADELKPNPLKAIYVDRDASNSHKRHHE